MVRFLSGPVRYGVRKGSDGLIVAKKPYVHRIKVGKIQPLLCIFLQQSMVFPAKTEKTSHEQMKVKYFFGEGNSLVPGPMNYFTREPSREVWRIFHMCNGQLEGSYFQRAAILVCSRTARIKSKSTLIGQ